MTNPAPMMDDAAVTFDSVSKNFGDVRALDQVSLAIGRGEFMTLLGPSGCGKTTLLKLAAGFLAPDSGTVAIDGKCVNDVPTYQREIGMMFQNYALFPHMSVAENIAYGLKTRHVRAARDPAARRGSAGAGQADRHGGSQAAAIIGRPAAARGAGARARHQSHRAAARRAFLGARQESARRRCRSNSGRFNASSA